MFQKIVCHLHKGYAPIVAFRAGCSASSFAGNMLTWPCKKCQTTPSLDQDDAPRSAGPPPDAQTPGPCPPPHNHARRIRSQTTAPDSGAPSSAAPDTRIRPALEAKASENLGAGQKGQSHCAPPSKPQNPKRPSAESQRMARNFEGWPCH